MKFGKSRIFQAGAFWLVLLFWLQLPVSGQDKSCLWKVETETCTTYFLGSIHMLKKESYPLNSAIEDAYNQAQMVVFEVNLDSSQSPRLQQKIVMKAMAKDGKSLQDRLSPEVYERAAREIKETGADISQFNLFKPWFFAVSLMTLKVRQLGFDPVYGIDNHFFTKAKEDEKPVLGLETLDFQIDLFDELNLEDQEAIVQQTLDEIDLMEEELGKMIEFWKAGETAQLEEMVLKSFKDYPHIYNTFLVQRNQKWIGTIESLLKGDKNSLIITGTAHLLGEEGVLSLLEEKGYKVEQL